MKPCQTGHTRVVVDVKGFLTFLVFSTIQKLTETSQFCRFIPLSSILTASIMYGTSKRFTTKPGVSYKETKLILLTIKRYFSVHNKKKDNIMLFLRWH